jgi:signal transduction histidine kinase
MLVLTLLFAGVELVTGTWMDVWELVAEGVVLLLFSLGIVAAQVLTQHGRLAAAAQVVAYGLLGVGMVSAPIVPYGLAPLSFVPLLAVTTALPYVRRRPLQVLFGMAFLGEVVLTVLTLVTPPRRILPVFTPLLIAGAVLSAVLLSLILLYQFSERLQNTLEVSLAANARLHASEEELRRAVQARDDFLGQAGHELRTPLTSLKLQIQVLRNAVKAQAEDAPLAKLAPRLAMVDRQVKRLETLTTTLLDISRLSTGRMVLELAEVDLGQLTRDAVASTLEQSSASGELVRVEARSITGHWDAFRLEQVITNLLSNALKYGAGRPVEVSVHQEGEEAVLTVRDQGLGIPPEDQARIFERFERAASGRHYPGVGLGLWIVREVVHALGGTVTLDSRTGEGSTFTVRLPRCGPPA